eukprot:scaffold2933_cov245-Pinguiococcus_pyrenoidosus.AAC.2
MRFRLRIGRLGAEGCESWRLWNWNLAEVDLHTASLVSRSQLFQSAYLCPVLPLYYACMSIRLSLHWPHQEARRCTTQIEIRCARRSWAFHESDRRAVSRGAKTKFTDERHRAKCPRRIFRARRTLLPRTFGPRT